MSSRAHLGPWIIHWAEAMNRPAHDDAPATVQLACDREHFIPIALQTPDGRAGICTDLKRFAVGIGDVSCTDCKAIIKTLLEGNFE